MRWQTGRRCAVAKISYMDLPVRVFLPMTPGDVCLGLIGDGPVLFKGKTPGTVRKLAEEWRATEMEKLKAKMPKGAVVE